MAILRFTAVRRLFSSFRCPYNRHSGFRRNPASYIPGYGNGAAGIDSGFRRNDGWGRRNDGEYDYTPYGNIKDTILFYSVSPRRIICHKPVQAIEVGFYSVSPRRITRHPQPELLSDAEIARLYPHADPAGRRYATTPLHTPGITRDGPSRQALARNDPVH